MQARLTALCDRESGVRPQGPGVSLGTGGRRQALQTEDDHRWGDRQMCGKHRRRGTSHGCADGSCREGVVNEAAGPPARKRGFLTRDGPQITFLLATGGCLLPSRQTDRPSAFDRVHALGSSWEAADQTQDEEEMWEPRTTVALSWAACSEPRSARRRRCPCPRADQGRGWEEDGFSFGRLEASKAMKSGQAQYQLVTTSATEVPLRPAGSHHGAVHVHAFAAVRGRHGILSNTGAILLLSQGFPGWEWRGRGGRRGRDIVSYPCLAGGGGRAVQLAHQARFQVSILRLLAWWGSVRSCMWS